MDCPREYRPPAGRCNHGPAKGSRYRPRIPEPFDPDELTRRLYLVLAEQRARAEGQKLARAETERRLRHFRSVPEASMAIRETPPLFPTQTRPMSDTTHGREQTHDVVLHPSSSSLTSTGSSHKEAEQALSSGYRHIPQVAASQFARTTTVDSPADRQLVHKLSRKAMKFHIEGPNADRDMAAAAKPGAAPFEQAQALSRVRSSRERQYERNQFQHAPALATMVETDEQQPRRPNRHTFEAYFRPKGGGHDDQGGPRRRSAGSVLGRADAAPGPSFETPLGLVPVERRESEGIVDPSEHHPVDWTQSDEARARPATLPRPLRKPESRWTLKGRLGGLVKHSRHESEKPPPFPPDEAREPQESLKSLRCGGFFSRFRR